MLAHLQAVETKLGPEAGQAGSKFEWLTFQDLEGSVVEDLKKLEESPLVPDDVTLLGLIYDVSMLPGMHARLVQSGVYPMYDVAHDQQQQ